MRSLIAEDFSANAREVHVQSSRRDLADPETPMGWRQMTRYSGFNMLTLGILYETVLRWVAAGEPRAGLRLEADPAAARSRAGKEGAGRHARQRPGPDDPGRRLVRRLSPERLCLARQGDGGRVLRQRRDLDLRPPPRRDPRRSANGRVAAGSCRSPTTLRAAGRSRPISSPPSAASDP